MDCLSNSFLMRECVHEYRSELDYIFSLQNRYFPPTLMAYVHGTLAGQLHCLPVIHLGSES